MQTDAMNAGVAPGGLKSRIEIRVLICYILVNSDLPVPLEAVKEQMHFRGIANYFETAYAIADLTDNGTITENINDSGIKLYSPTDEAKKVAGALSASLPFSVKEKALAIARGAVDRLRYERENKVLVEKAENGFYVTCSVMEKDIEVVSIKLLVPDDETAGTVKDNFLSDPVETLVNATAALTGSQI